MQIIQIHQAMKAIRCEKAQHDGASSTVELICPDENARHQDEQRREQ